MQTASATHFAQPMIELKPSVPGGWIGSGSGTCAMTCCAPSSVVAVTDPASVCGTPCHSSSRPTMMSRTAPVTWMARWRRRSQAETGGVVVQKAVAAMGEIERSSDQISQIIGVIDEIAFQTNLLALNAGVEAARAGDSGRGFAVVASEVRALAQRSAGAAKEIKSLISASSQEVGRGVGLVNEASSALNGITDQVAQMDQLASDIAAAAQEQGQLQVYWVNLTSLRTGVTPLGNYGINPAGPATLSATADTGSGQVLAVVHGSVRTVDNVCPFAPTAASINVR